MRTPCFTVVTLMPGADLDAPAGVARPRGASGRRPSVSKGASATWRDGGRRRVPSRERQGHRRREATCERRATGPLL
jgi:hypothetical protein